MPRPREAEPVVPAIETQRLVLRGFRVEDFADSAALWADPDVTRFIGGRPSTEEESWTRFLRYLGHWSALGFGYWAVREKNSGRYVGEVGFADYRRDIEPSLGGAPEIGWVLAAWPGFCHRGGRRRFGLGRPQFRHPSDRLHHQPRPRALDPCRSQGRLRADRQRDLQGPNHPSVRAPADCLHSWRGVALAHGHRRDQSSSSASPKSPTSFNPSIQVAPSRLTTRGGSRDRAEVSDARSDRKTV